MCVSHAARRRRMLCVCPGQTRAGKTCYWQIRQIRQNARILDDTHTHTHTPATTVTTARTRRGVAGWPPRGLRPVVAGGSEERWLWLRVRRHGAASSPQQTTAIEANCRDLFGGQAAAGYGGVIGYYYGHAIWLCYGFAAHQVISDGDEGEAHVNELGHVLRAEEEEPQQLAVALGVDHLYRSHEGGGSANRSSEPCAFFWVGEGGAFSEPAMCLSHSNG